MIGDRIITLKFVVDQEIFNVISTYAPHVRLEEHLKEFWKELTSLIHNILLVENMFLEGDLTGHVSVYQKVLRACMEVWSRRDKYIG